MPESARLTKRTPGAIGSIHLLNTGHKKMSLRSDMEVPISEPVRLDTQQILKSGGSGHGPAPAYRGHQGQLQSTTYESPEGAKDRSSPRERWEN
jgi:hypothetical protein